VHDCSLIVLTNTQCRWSSGITTKGTAFNQVKAKQTTDDQSRLNRYFREWWGWEDIFVLPGFAFPCMNLFSDRYVNCFCMSIRSYFTPAFVSHYCVRRPPFCFIFKRYTKTLNIQRIQIRTGVNCLFFDPCIVVMTVMLQTPAFPVYILCAFFLNSLLESILRWNIVFFWFLANAHKHWSPILFCPSLLLENS